jgi:hypothetical protein
MKPALVKIDVAAVDLSMGIRRIEQLVDGGSPNETGLLWVFNLAGNPGGRMRSLRFWRPELLARSGGQAAEINQMQIGQVIAEILPPRRERFHAGEIDQLFQIRPNTRIDLDADLKGKREGSRFVYRREPLENFLKARWLGGKIA